MRGYHIRITLQSSTTQIPTTSTSVKESSPLQRATQDPFIPQSLFQQLPNHASRLGQRRRTFIAPRQNSESGVPVELQEDWRFGPIRIDWVDCAQSDMTLGKTAVGKDREGTGRDPITASFVAAPHKQGVTNLPEGVVHIYRESEPPILRQLPSGQKDPLVEQPEQQPSPHGSATDPGHGVTLAVLAVPSWMTPSDFLAFVAPSEDGIALLRMIRDSTPNRSMVVMQFRTETAATEFVEEFNGKQFNSMESEICNVVRVLSVSIDTDDQVSAALSRSSSTVYELPTCPVCLERMDSAVTGLVTVPCSHTFHCACLSKWGDSRCPVCRYSQNLITSHPTSSTTARSSHSIAFAPPSTASPQHCVNCGSTANLWICLICGNIGCGRYGRAHAHAHYTHTTHLYALELETQRVWDYAGDGYVHRLIQNKADGKLVELPSASSTVGRAEGGGGPSATDVLTAEKIEAIGIEYSYLLTSQLDSQRTFYEEQTTDLRGQVEQLREMVERLGHEVEQTRVLSKETEAKRLAEQQAQDAEYNKEKARLEKRAGKATELVRTLQKDLAEERAVSKGLMENLRKTKERNEQAEKEKIESRQKVQELEDQVRDLMFFLEAKEKIESGGGAAGEAAGGSIELGASTSSARHKKKGKK